MAVALDEKGSDLEPNTLTQVAFQKSTVTRLPAPYKANCYNSWEVAGYPEIKKHIPALPYSISVSSRFSVHFRSIILSKQNNVLQQCRRLCTQSKMIQYCNCFHPLYLDFPWQANLSSISPCNLSTGGKYKHKF